MKYSKCGEILLAPSISFKYQYILKCSECDEIYTAVDAFLSHCHSHERSTTSIKPTRDTDTHLKESPETTAARSTDIKYNDSKHPTGFEDPLDVLKEEYVSENEDICEEEGFQSPGELSEDEGSKCKEELSANEVSKSIEEISVDEDSKSIEDINADECAKSTEEISSDEDFKITDYVESDDEQFKYRTKKTSTFVLNFMKSPKNFTTLISAYKNQPYLWNSDLSSQIRAKDRPTYLQQIATEVKEKINVQLTNNQVAAVIRYLRREYRNKVNHYDPKEKYAPKPRKKTSPMSLSQQLDFLRPFIEINSITHFDSQTELVPEQIVQILEIYERFPHLWNTNIIENVCTNKRQESLEQMQIVLESEMGLETNPNSLKRYLYSVHIHCAREKRTNMSNKPEYRCKFFENMLFLIDHVAPFKCTVCRRGFRSNLTLKIHNSEHDGLETLRCSLCNKEYKTTATYTLHAKRHMQDLKEECNECGKRFIRLADLNIHMRSHTGVTPYCCELCGAAFRYIHELTTHKRRHFKQYLHKCPICSKGFYAKVRMDDHMRTHTNIRTFICKICGKAFKLKKTLQQHEFTHEEGRNHICTLCGKTYKNKIGLSHHMRTHRSNIELIEPDSNFISIFNE